MSEPISHPACAITRIRIDPSSGVAAVANYLDSALRSARVLHIVGGDESHDALQFWAAVCESLGVVDLRGENPVTLQRIPAVWNDIRYDPALAQAYRHSKTAQPLHTDGAYNAHPPSIGMFFCEAQAANGGRTLFLDGSVLFEALERHDPALLNQLRNTLVRFGKGDSPGQTIPILGGDKACPTLNWNYHRIVPKQGLEVDTLRDTFAHFLTTYFPEGQLAPLHLMPGDCMMFHDLRVLHGREAFEAEMAGQRCLWNLNLHWQPTTRALDFLDA